MACLKPGIGRRLIRGQHSHSHLASTSPSLSDEPTTLKLPTAAQHCNIWQLPNLNLFLSLHSFHVAMVAGGLVAKLVEICCPCIELLQPKLKLIHPFSQGSKEVYAMPINPSQIV